MPKSSSVPYQCENCGQWFMRNNNRQVYCKASECRELAAEKNRKYQRQWRSRDPHKSTCRAQYKDYKGVKCGICGKPLSKKLIESKYTRHPVCTANVSSRTDGDWIYTDAGDFA